MTAIEFRAALSRLGMLQKDFAALVGRDINTVSRWATDAKPVPRIVEVVLRQMERARDVAE